MLVVKSMDFFAFYILIVLLFQYLITWRVLEANVGHGKLQTQVNVNNFRMKFY
jgi:hypothetical protein